MKAEYKARMTKRDKNCTQSEMNRNVEENRSSRRASDTSSSADIRAGNVSSAKRGTEKCWRRLQKMYAGKARSAEKGCPSRTGGDDSADGHQHIPRKYLQHAHQHKATRFKSHTFKDWFPLLFSLSPQSSSMLALRATVVCYLQILLFHLKSQFLLETSNVQADEEGSLRFLFFFLVLIV